MSTSQNNRVSIKMSEEAVKSIQQKLQEVNELLTPYFTTLTVEERRTLPKMSDKTVAFVEKATGYANTNAVFSPGFLDVPELVKDLIAVKDIKPIWEMVQQIESNLNDTVLLAGSEAYVGSLLYYRSVQHAAAQGINDAKPIYDDLQQRFPGRKRKSSLVVV
jgi:hypothetical protein